MPSGFLIFRLQECDKAVPGGAILSDWSNWSTCTKSCGEGIEVRRRECLNNRCRFEEALSEERRCFLQACPLNADNLFPILPLTPPILNEWHHWSSWGMCFSPKSCGSGYKQRFRACRDGFDCSTKGPSFEIQPCTNSPCPDELRLERRKRDWSEWSEWSANCKSGRQVRTRSCNSPLVFLCDGFAKEERMCVQKSEVARGFLPQWSEWSDFSQCSCFSLKQFRRRFCTIRDPSVQGFCIGALIDQRSCEPTHCASINGGWSSWSDFSECSNECGSGYKIRNRMCSSPLPSNRYELLSLSPHRCLFRGAYCLGYSFDQARCVGTKICGGNAIDGSWSEWLPFSGCNAGQRSRTRYCINPSPKNGGRQCMGNDFELQVVYCISKFAIL